MIKLKSKEEIARLKAGGRILARVLDELKKYTLENYKSGKLTTKSIDDKAVELLSVSGARASFKDLFYKGAKMPYPTSTCISVNDEVVHGIPSDRVLKEGDLIGIDIGVIYDDLYTDAAISFILGAPRREDEIMLEVTKAALYRGIDMAVLGNTIGDIGFAIEKHIRSAGFDLVEDYCGHGVGYSVHEDPSVPNYGKRGGGEAIEEGLVIAIEPMVVMGSGDVYVDKNGWTVKTADGKRSAHFEHTIAVTKDGPLVLTESL